VHPFQKRKRNLCCGRPFIYKTGIVPFDFVLLVISEEENKPMQATDIAFTKQELSPLALALNRKENLTPLCACFRRGKELVNRTYFHRTGCINSTSIILKGIVEKVIIEQTGSNYLAGLSKMENVAGSPGS